MSGLAAGLLVPERRFLARWMGLGLLLILVAAVRSEGFFAADEHFQVLEFAGAKLGRTPVSALPWEYEYRMRPWLQPALYTLGARGLAALGVRDPFVWALSFRLGSGLLAWIGLVGLGLCAERFIPEPKARRLAIRALVLLYPIPFLAVRTSAESLSTSCFVLALCLLVLRGEVAGPGRLLLAGALLGLSCGLRYAEAVPVVSLLGWMVFVDRTPARRLSLVVLGAAAALMAALAVDRWGYGEWTLAAWNYLYRNLAEDRAALQFGSRPWYGCLVILTLGPFGPLNLLLAGAALRAWLRHPRHVLTWATLPPALVHCAIAHKELRFLFPIAMLSPLLLALAGGAWTPRGWKRLLAGAFLAYDLVALAALCLLPAQPQVSFQRFVSRRFPAGFFGFFAATRSPWVWSDLTMHFYGPPPPGLRAWGGSLALAAAGVTRFNLATSSWEPLPPVAPYECRPLYQPVPEWLVRAHQAAGGGRRPVSWDLHRCTLTAAPPLPLLESGSRRGFDERWPPRYRRHPRDRRRLPEDASPENAQHRTRARLEPWSSGI